MVATSLFKSLTSRSFALLWAGQTISRLGDSLYAVALSWWVLQTTGSAAAMGTVLVCMFAPMIIFLLLGGALVDRLPRIRLMVVSDMLSGAVVGLVALLAFTNQLQLWHVYVASTVFGFVSAFFEPAYQAVIPDLTPYEALPSANSLTSLSRQIIGVLGPALGAALVAAGGTPIAFACNALSFFLSAALVSPLPELVPAEPAARASHILADVRAGLGLVLRTPWLWITIVIFALVNVTASAPISIALPFLVSGPLKADVGMLGMLLSVASAGAVVSAMLVGGIGRFRHRGLLAYGASLVAGLAICSIGVPMGVIGVAIALFIQSAMFTLFGLIWMNTLQELVPREMMGRVLSVDMLGSFALLPFAYLLIGWLSDHLGPSMVFLIGGVATMVLISIGLFHPAIRRLD